MRKPTLTILATSILALPAIAAAQPGPPPGPPPGMHGPPPGATWQGHMGGQMGGQGQVHTFTLQRQGGPGPQMQMHQMQMHGGMHGRMNFPRHFQRGFVIPPFFFGSQFYVDDWQAYGFSDPGPDGRWIRYYDDAYLIDRDGRIVDSRDGMDWGRHGDDWDDDDGMPVHRRHGGGDYGYAYGGGYGGPPMQGGGYAYGGGYGYGFYAYPIVIETVTTSGGGYMEEVTEEVVQVRHHRRARCTCTRPAPHRAPPPRRPPPGERG